MDKSQRRVSAVSDAHQTQISRKMQGSDFVLYNGMIAEQSKALK